MQTILPSVHQREVRHRTCTSVIICNVMEQCYVLIGNATLIINSTTGSSLELFHFPTGVQYTCTHSQNGNFTSFNITEQGYNLTGLRPDTTYTIDCVAYLNGVDYCLEVNTSARTGGLQSMHSTRLCTFTIIMHTYPIQHLMKWTT